MRGIDQILRNTWFSCCGYFTLGRSPYPAQRRLVLDFIPGDGDGFEAFVDVGILNFDLVDLAKF
jgi:hypothetical protein